MCLVESKGAPKPLASCAFPAMPGQVISTTSAKVNSWREGVMEFLLANHPLDCPICDWGGECDLQDQSMRYGADRGRFHEFKGKRAVEDKYMGPLVKTVMTRCIHCTRCVRFSNEIAGVQDLGTTGRGNDLQIGMYVEKVLDSELSGNVIDLCPVGALTAKPGQFNSRPWELKNTESIDVLDAVGCNIRVDSRGVQVLRVLPRTNDDVNEEWINDKTRFAVDGLKYQRLTAPLIKQGDRFVPASWPEALSSIAEGLVATKAEGNEIKAVAGALADTESLVALKDLVNRLGSENTVTDLPGGDATSINGVDIRSNYSFNSGIAGIEEADVVLLVGTSPRKEGTLVNARLRKAFLRLEQDLGVVGEQEDLTYDYTHLGTDAKGLNEVLNGTSDFAKKFQAAKNPLIIVGSGVLENPDGKHILAGIAQHIKSNKDRFLTPEWNGLSILQRTASRNGANDVGFAPSSGAEKTEAKFIYLLNADDFDPASIPESAFVVYQGHHGDVGAQYADVVLPGAAYTEKSVTYVNTEGRTQLTRAAVPPPGASREDWKVIRALSEVLGVTLPYDDTLELRDRLFDISPTLVRYDVAERASPETAELGLDRLIAQGDLSQATGVPLTNPIKNFYQTDVVSRASPTMTKCVKAFVERVPHDQIEDPVPPHTRLG